MEKFSGVPVWHASVALIPMKPIGLWTRQQREHAERLLRAALNGVGTDNELREDHPFTIQVRRLATYAEAARLGGTQDRRVTLPGDGI